MLPINLFKTLPLILINCLLLHDRSAGADRKSQQPNVIIIMADDMGFDDVSFRGSNRFLTPNIDALAYSGIILNNLYTGPMCTPSRAALLTGKYPIHTGMQHYVIVNDEPWGLPIEEMTMAELFHKNGYYTSLIGKWHQGMSRKAFTPTQRGFDHHFGYLGAYIDYWDHTLYMPSRNYSRGHDLKRNLERVHFAGQYATHLFTQEAVNIIKKHDITDKPLFMLLSHLAPHSGNDDAPVQAPQLEIAKFDYIKDEKDRTYAAMMSVLDKSVGQVVEALAEKDLLDNTIIVFLSDNGGPTEGLHSTGASNYPLKGQKNSPWEGALRTSGVIWSKELEQMSIVWNQRIYIGDFLKTLAAACYINVSNKISETIDGLNLWFALKFGYQSVEREILHNIDEVFDYVSYMKGKWKFINGTTSDGEYDRWLGKREKYRNNNDTDPRAKDYAGVIQNTTVWKLLNPNLEEDKSVHIEQLRSEATITCQLPDPVLGLSCNPLEGPCLFDLDVDPCEQKNLYEEMKNTKTFNEILERVQYFRQSAHEINNQPSDISSDPKFYNYEWTWWQDIQDDKNSSKSLFSMSNGIHQNFYLILAIFFIYSIWS